jgi:hypothetical protein
LTRTLAGGAAGFLLGGPGGAITGALLARSFGGATPAAAAAGAAAGRAFGSRFMGVIGGILRGLRSMAVWGIAIYAIEEIVRHWEGFKTQILGIFDGIRQAAPTWLGGEGQGWTPLRVALHNAAKEFRDWFRDSDIAKFMQWTNEQTWGRAGRALTDAVTPLLPTARLGDFFRDYVSGRPMPWQDLERAAGGRSALPPPSGTFQQRDGRLIYTPASVTTGPINVTVNVTQATSANPNAIGEAAGGAVRSALRQLLADPAFGAAGAN